MSTTCTTTEVAVHCANCRRWLTGVTGSKPVEVRLKCPKCRAHHVYVVESDGVTATRKVLT